MCTRVSANVGREKIKQQQKHRHFRLIPVGLPLQKTIITSPERPLQDCCALMISLVPPPASASLPWVFTLQRVSGLCLETLTC